MKVSILTYHWEDNYGATMQAYATQKAVMSLGHDAEFIDLRLPYNPSLISRIVFSLKRNRFNAFRKKYYHALSHTTYWSVEELRSNPPLSDCYLVGSDQTWNPLIAKALLPAFFLTFGDTNVRRITYATSIGLNEWEPSTHISDAEITAALSRFDKVLLREDSAVKIAKDNFNADAKQVIDPVLLFNSYDELIGKKSSSNEIVSYKLIDDAGFYEVGREISELSTLPIRSIGSVRRPKGFRTAYPETVNNWLARIANAKYLITDSFHGTVFALLYHVPFVIYIGDPKRITRLKSLLDQVNLIDRILTGTQSSDKIWEKLNEPINWEKVDKKIETLRNDSLNALKEALSGH